MSINFSLVLPCYNEEDNVLPLYKEINELPLEDEKCEIVFVNNGSMMIQKKLMKLQAITKIKIL